MCAGALSLVSGVFGAVQQMQQGKAQAALHKHQAQVQRRNARIARDKGALKGADINRRSQLRVGEKIASSAAGGLSHSGSVALAIKELIHEDLAEKAAVLHDAEAQRSNHIIASQRSEAQARIVKSQATSSFFSSLLGTASSFAKSGALKGFN